MNQPWGAEILRLTLLVGGMLLLGALFDRAGLFFVLSLLAYLGWHLFNLRRLEHWLREGRAFNPPESSGIWGEVFYLFYRVQERARARKRRLAAIVGQFQEATAAMPDATVVLGPQHEIQWFNDAAQQMLDLHAGQDVGQRVHNLIRHPEFARFLEHGNESGVLLMPSPEDAEVTLSARVVPYGQAQRLLILRDVSQQQRLLQMRRDFVANVSHELRTPLTVVAGFLETIIDEQDACAEKWGRSLELMQQQTRRMQHLVEDLLLLARLEADRDRPPRDPVSVPALLATIREDAAQLSGERRHVITLDADPAIGLSGSDKELHSAFGNLVINAVHYTPPGGEIAIRWWADAEGAHFSVRDSGIGIEPRHIPRLTERFYRVDVGRSRDSGGTGLGLAIVKHVLNRHDGRLHVESTPGKGSTFTCDFPSRRVLRPIVAAATRDA